MYCLTHVHVRENHYCTINQAVRVVFLETSDYTQAKVSRGNECVCLNSVTLNEHVICGTEMSFINF